MVEAATRVNYASDVEGIHGLGGAVSMAATGASQVKGGVSARSVTVLRYIDSSSHVISS